MKFSIQALIKIVVALLCVASAIALYFAIGDSRALPLLLIAVINTGVVAFLLFLMSRGVIRPLQRIRDIVMKVGGGDFSARATFAATREITEFAKAINEMIIKLQDAHRHEKEVERLKTEFLSLAAHQLRNPLATTKWTLQSLLQGDLGKLSHEQKEYLAKIYTSNEKLINLITDLLDITRIEDGRYLYQPLPFQLENVLEALVKSYQAEAQRKGIVFQYMAPQETYPKVVGDEEKIRIVIQNFIENSLRYTPQGGKVTVSLKHDTKDIEVAVHDTGIGIPETQQAHIFERFFRADNAKKINEEGTGLGLYLAKNIIEAHRGKIWFESQENKGTTFAFSLPL